MGSPVAWRGFSQQLQSFFRQPLERVRRSARFVGTAAQRMGTGFAHSQRGSTSCARLSTEHGPAMMTMPCPPMDTPLSGKVVLSGLNSREASL